MKKNYKLALLCTAGALIMSNVAHASGYQLNEFSATGLGRAFSGAGIVGDDYSAIAFNPAGMMLKDSGIQGGLTSVQMHSNVTGEIESTIPYPNTPNGRMNLWKALPHFFGQYKLNDKTRVGLGVYSPFGLASVYNYNWFGAGHGTKTELEVVDVAAALAYQIDPKVSIGGSVIYRYVHGNLINAFTKSGYFFPGTVNQMDLDGWDFAYSFGLMFEPVKGTRFGASYRINNAHTVKGQNKIYGLTTPPFSALNGIYEGRSTMTLPDTLTLSAFHKLNDKIDLTATARYTRWSVFDDFVMQTTAGGGSVVRIPERWGNVWTYSLGMDYHYNDNWTFRTGVAYDPTPIRNSTFRTARIPDSDRFWVTVGTSYKKDNMQFDLGYSHLFMRTGRSNNTYEGLTLHTRHENYSNMIGAQIQYNF